MMKIQLRILILIASAITNSVALSAAEQRAAAGSPTPPVYGQVVAIDAPAEIMSVQRLPNFVGVSGRTAGSKHLTMNLVVIPPGGRAEPHSHQGFESAVYVLEGRVETRWGPNLEHSIISEAGDFIFIPPDVPHQPINLSATEPARAIVVRNDPNEQEHVMLHPAQPEPKAP